MSYQRSIPHRYKRFLSKSKDDSRKHSVKVNVKHEHEHGHSGVLKWNRERPKRYKLWLNKDHFDGEAEKLEDSQSSDNNNNGLTIVDDEEADELYAEGTTDCNLHGDDDSENDVAQLPRALQQVRSTSTSQNMDDEDTPQPSQVSSQY